MEDSEARELLELIKDWEDFIDRIRSFFKGRGYTEVFTPILNPYPNLDTNVEPVPVELNLRGRKKRFWLHTSPEYSMKKLLAKVKADIFQITKVFRDGELSRLHRPEFTMLEWYKVGGDYGLLMEEVQHLLRGLLSVEEVKRISVEEAFKTFLGIELSDSREDLYESMRKAGYEVDKEDSWEELFFRAFIELEKHLKGAVFLTDFPKPAAALAKIKGNRAERFELFIDGVEVANGWTEETNGREVRARLIKEAKARRLPLDESFIEAHSSMPDSAGCSVGLDRLFLLRRGANSLDQLKMSDVLDPDGLHN